MHSVQSRLAVCLPHETLWGRAGNWHSPGSLTILEALACRKSSGPGLLTCAHTHGFSAIPQPGQLRLRHCQVPGFPCMHTLYRLWLWPPTPAPACAGVLALNRVLATVTGDSVGHPKHHQDSSGTHRGHPPLHSHTPAPRYDHNPTHSQDPFLYISTPNPLC